MTISGSELKLEFPGLMEHPLQTIPRQTECLNNASGDMVMDKEGVIWVGTDKGLNALQVLFRIQHRVTSPLESIRPSNDLSNAELKNGGFKPVFEIYNNKTVIR